MSIGPTHIHGNARVRLGNIAFGLIITGAAWTAGRVVRARTESAAWHARRAERLELGLAPQPGLRDLDTLPSQVREAGLPIELTLEGTPQPLPFGVDLSAYRLIQESLTNTLKYAGRAQARVRVCYGPDELELELEAGASGFLLKSVPPQKLADAVRTIAAGEALLAPTITRRLVEQFVRRPPPGHTIPGRLDELTERERDVLLLVARGNSNAEIAEKLFVSPATVKTHVTHVFQRLGLRDRVQAVILAYETGLVQPGATETP